MKNSHSPTPSNIVPASRSQHGISRRASVARILILPNAGADTFCCQYSSAIRVALPLVELLLIPLLPEVASMVSPPD